MITIKKPEEIKKLAEGGKLLASILKKASKACKPGVDLLEIEKLIDKMIAEVGAEPSFKNYQGFPSSTCMSVNEEVVHCAPRSYKIKEGDLVSLDCGLIYKGLYTDMAVTVPVGLISLEADKLVKVTKKALEIGIDQARPGNKVGDIGAAIQEYVEGQDLSVVRQLVGHGVGYKVHEEPRIPNFGKPGTGPELKEGMVLALEPMVNIGGPDVTFEEDGWRVITSDNSLSAHFEKTIVITKKGPKVLTK